MAMQRSLLWKTLQMPARILTSLMFDLQVHNVENVPAEGGVLLAANHQSNLDPVLVAVRLRRPVSFLAKEELFKNFFLRNLIESLHAFPIKQNSGDLGAVRETMRRLEEGHVLNVYPEGTRTDDGKIQPLQKGIALIIRKTAAPVVPVAIEGSFYAWTKGRKVPRPGKIDVMYGKPMRFEGMKADEILTGLHGALVALLEELKEKRRIAGRE
ncbi:MAG: lysophospholipid acyltransferase family protein [Tepidisphaeraceae bacterium]|jgi:1-acyl-sn-glycerol-3-phosphate acyltransferase